MSDNEIEVLISAQADQLKDGMDDAKAAVTNATGQMKDGLDQLSSSSSGSSSQLKDGMAAAAAAVTNATGQMKDGLDQLSSSSSGSFSQILSNLAELKTAFMGLGALVGGGAFLKGAVDQYVDMNLEAKKLSNQMGTSVQDAAAMINAYERMGVSEDTVSQAMRMLERNIKTNGDAVVDMGRQVGVNIDLNGSLKDIYFQVTEALGKYEVGHQRNQAALAAFGARVQNINDLLLVNKENVEESALHLAKLGLALDDVSVNKARNFKAGMHDVGLQFDALKYKVGEVAIPILTKLGQTLIWLTDLFKNMMHAEASMDAEGALMAMGEYGPPKDRGLTYPSGAGGQPAAKGASYEPLDKSQGGGSGSAGPGLLQQWKDELEQLKTEQSGFLDFSKQAEKAFWQDKLAQCAEGSKEYLAVSRELYTLDKGLAQDAAKEKLVALNRQMTSEKTDWEARKGLMAQEVAFVKTTYGEQSSEYRAVLQKKAQFDQEYDKQSRTLAQSRLDEELKLGQMRIQAAQEEVKFKESMGQISASTALAQEKTLTQQSLALEQQHLDQSKANWTGYYAELQKLDQQEAEFKEKKLLEVQKANEQAAQKQLQDIKGAIAPIDSAISGMVNGFIQGTLTMQKAMQNMTTAILSAFLGAVEKMATTWIANQLQMLIYGKTAQTAAAVGQITSDAAVAAAGAYASTTAIPVVGPEMAPAAAMEAYAAVMAFAGMASYDTGAWGIPRAGAAVLHPGEAVLPATKAAGLDRLIEGGGTPGGANVQIHPGAVQIVAMDGADVQRVLMANPAALSAAIKNLGRNFVPV